MGFRFATCLSGHSEPSRASARGAAPRRAPRAETQKERSSHTSANHTTNPLRTPSFYFVYEVCTVFDWLGVFRIGLDARVVCATYCYWCRLSFGDSLPHDLQPTAGKTHNRTVLSACERLRLSARCRNTGGNNRTNEHAHVSPVHDTCRGFLHQSVLPHEVTSFTRNPEPINAPLLSDNAADALVPEEEYQEQRAQRGCLCL